MLGNRAHLLDDLYTTGSCANHPDLLVTQFDAFLGPNSGMMAFPLEGLQALERRNVAFGGEACAWKEVPCTCDMSIFGGDGPLIPFLVKFCRRHASIETTVLADLQLLIDEFEVRFEFVPPWKTFGPSPLTPYLLQGEFV